MKTKIDFYKEILTIVNKLQRLKRHYNKAEIQDIEDRIVNLRMSLEFDTPKF